MNMSKQSKESQYGRYPGFYTKTSMLQLGYGIWVNLSTVAIGLAFGFPAVQIPQLINPNSNFKITADEASWLVSILTLFCPIGCMLSGIMMDKFGRSVMLRCCQLPMFVGWMGTVLSNTVVHMIIARAVLGFGIGMAMGPSRLYTAEISLPNMRGLLGALPNLFASLGMTLQAALGLFFTWSNLCYICGTFNMVLFISYIFLMETPYYLLLQDKIGKAKQSLTQFRAKDYDIEKEISDLINFKEEHNIRSLNCREKLKAMTAKNAYRPFGIIMVFITCECLAGTPIVTLWTIELLLALKSSIDVYKGNFYISFTRLLFCGIASALLFRTHRRTMALISVGGVSATCLSLAIFLYLEEGPSVFPQVLLIIYTAFASLGFYILPFLFMSEMYPLQIRGTLTGLSISIINVQKFLTAKCFLFLRDDIGLPITMLLFSLSAFICFIFLCIFLPETKDLTLQEIEEYFIDYNQSSNSTQSQRSKGCLFSRLQNLINKKKDKEIIEIFESSAASDVSRDSKKSVKLLIGSERFNKTGSLVKIWTDEKSDQILEKSQVSTQIFDKDKKENKKSRSPSSSKANEPSTSKNA